MTAVDHLIAALVELEQQSIEIEHRQSFIRSAIEAFGIDADDALLVAMRAEGEPLIALDAETSARVTKSIIDTERTPVNHQAARDAAAAAL